MAIRVFKDSDHLLISVLSVCFFQISSGRFSTPAFKIEDIKFEIAVWPCLISI